MSNLLAAAYKYIENGICVIATDKEKKSIVHWKKYQEHFSTMDDVEFMFEQPRAAGLAIMCGKVSGNLECIDVDIKYDKTGTLWDEYTQAIKDNDEALFDKLKIVQTRSGGYHIYYRCQRIEGNHPLARRHATEQELKDEPGKGVRVLIETRGEGGYACAPPTAGYKSISNNNPIPDLTVDERDMLLELARTFNQVVEQPVKHNSARGYNAKEFGLSPFEDYNKRGDVVGLLVRYGWKVIKETGERIIVRRPGKDIGTSGDILKEKMWFKVFTTSSIFDAGKAYLPYAVYAMLECNGDFKEAAKKLLNEGYGERREFFGDKLEKQLYKRKLDGQPKDELVSFLVNKHDKKKEEAEEIVDKLEKIWGEKTCTFWDISESGKLSIHRGKLMEFLHITGGFSLYYYDKNSTIFKIVQCKGGFIEDVSTEHIKKFILSYIDSLPETFDNNTTPDEVRELVLRGSDSLFSKGLMEFLNRASFDFLKDTEKEAFFTFRNGVVCVTEDKVELRPYAELNKVVWKRQVIDFEIHVEPGIDCASAEYFRFIDLISGEDPDRREYAMTLIGYILHTYKDPTKAFAPVAAEETENEKEGGGTGKGIFFKAISKLIQTVIIDGKSFKQDKSFAFQRVGLDTKLVVFEDVKKNVDFEGFYPMITEGMTVEKKNKDELFIPYSDSPKIGFTTNYNVNATGNHGKRRQKVLEFSGFFKPGNSPEDYFGHKLFDDWDIHEWNRFYNLMFVCVQAYFQEGVKEVMNSEKIKRKQVKLNYGEEFLEWWDDWTSDTPDNVNKPFGKEILLQDLHKGFLMDYGFTEKDYSNKRMKSAIVFGAEQFGYPIKVRKVRQVGGGRAVVMVRPGEKIPDDAPKMYGTVKNAPGFFENS